MPETQHEQQQTQQYGGQPQQQFDPSQSFQGGTIPNGEGRSQVQFDQMFGEQVFSDTATREVAQAYWAQAEDTLRQARRISEIYAISLMQNQLVTKVAQAVVPQLSQRLQQQLTPQIVNEVLNALQRNPQWIKPAVQQAMQNR